MTERIRSGFHRSGLRERGKLVFVFAIFVSVCSNRDVPFLFVSPPMDEQISVPPHFFVGKNFSYPIVFVGPFENGLLLVVCRECSFIGKGERNKNGTFHTFSCLNDCLNMCL